MAELLAVLGIVAVAYLMVKITRLTATNAVLKKDVETQKAMVEQYENQQEEMTKAFAEEQEKNRSILSQKKYSETRLGQITEHLVPFLENCSHNPKDMHFLGNPIDYVIFDFDQGTITFLEVKSGNSKPSRRQKTVKHIVKQGRVYYEEIRVNEKGIKTKTAENV